MHIARIRVEPSCKNTYDKTKNTIFSPDYPAGFKGQGPDCTWHIKGHENETLIIEKLVFKVSSCHHIKYKEYVQIFDGDSEKSSKLADLCGYHTEAIAKISTGNSFFVKFHFYKRPYVATARFKLQIKVFQGNNSISFLE